MEETKGAMAMDGEYRPCKMLVRGGEVGRLGDLKAGDGRREALQ